MVPPKIIHVVFDGDKSHISIIRHTHNGLDRLNFNLTNSDAVQSHGLVLRVLVLARVEGVVVVLS
jgi:hypothetical protein